MSIHLIKIDMSQYQPDRAFDSLPKLPPRADVESKVILRSCLSARAEVGRLKEARRLLPNPSMLINTVPVLEAQASSEIENVMTTADRLFQFIESQDAGADSATKEAARYQTALKRGFESVAAKPLTTATAIDVCTALLGHAVHVRRLPGTALRNTATGAIVYTPPAGQALLRNLLGNWERYLHDQSRVDPLIRMAVGHYQFEAIHPFADGNGRTGRILNLLFLVEQQLLDLPILYLSKAIVGTKADYYRLLNDVTSSEAWEPWVVYMLNAVAQTAEWTTAKIHAIRDLLDETTAYVRRAAPKLYTRELVELIFAQPYARIGNVVAAGIAKRQTASEYLKELRDIGVLEEHKVGRDKLFAHPKLIALLKADDHVVFPYPS